jgi:hypothetical protein
VTGGRAVIAGTEDRQHAYAALSCGTDTNMAYVFTVSPGSSLGTAMLCSLLC